jgi:DNA polymerase III delta prime subunit
MHILESLDKNNLHHAYLIEGKKEKILPEIFKFVKDIGVEIHGNPDFMEITLDSFKIEDARNLKSQSVEKGLSDQKKIFIISINNFLIEAQNTLLKMFEEPIENTIFFIVLPDASIILPTLLSRFYLIKSEANSGNDLKEAEKFIQMSLPDRIFFIKELITEAKEEEDDLENVSLDSIRSKAIKFLNVLELVLHQKFLSKGIFDIGTKTNFFDQIFKAREYLRQPGSSTKSLMESVALVVPKL